MVRLSIRRSGDRADVSREPCGMQSGADRGSFSPGFDPGQPQVQLRELHWLPREQKNTDATVWAAVYEALPGNAVPAQNPITATVGVPWRASGKKTPLSPAIRTGIQTTAWAHIPLPSHRVGAEAGDVSCGDLARGAAVGSVSCVRTASQAALEDSVDRYLARSITDRQAGRIVHY
ncbi:hypothetical protein AAFF_G00201760 [Aldrovandia affinis]|uniref:Uncharacterized protein n=1 Tax=Aldrovandia affinis TaxID=143900 RepID=A0AAD7SWV1_9TELE|nr:hypothetical protein AAFF_G00201760 [Aldrovandia affinis]